MQTDVIKNPGGGALGAEWLLESRMTTGTVRWDACFCVHWSAYRKKLGHLALKISAQVLV
jgi:hypothetical protein